MCVCCEDMVSAGIIQWTLDYNAWDVLLGQVHALLNQVCCGAGLSYSSCLYLFAFLMAFFGQLMLYMVAMVVLVALVAVKCMSMS